MEVAIYRIVQEALTNVRRHAQATHANVDAQFLTDQIIVTIRDDGVGFAVPEETAELISMGGLGLMGLRERTQLFGGEMFITSETGQGTTVKVVLPRNPDLQQIGFYDTDADKETTGAL
jgi:two-component system sensor histidine kinase DegS